tara:strand:- start:15 stop:1001 length:987 start_codon:yes stop_codon:yes gene_type:complete
MTNNAKPTGLQTDIQEAEQSFESFLTPEEQPENETEQTSEDVVNEEEVIEDEILEEDEVEEDEEQELQEDQVEEEESEQPQLYTIKVDGQDTEVTLEELQNGYSRQRDYTRKTQELAEQRKAIEAQQQEVSQKDAIYSQLLPRMESTLKGELENEPDWNALYEADPIAYVREKDLWNEKKQKLQAVQAESKRIEEESNVEQQKKFQQFVEYGQQQLLNLIPEWQDNKIASREKTAIKDYAMSVLGYTQQEIDAVYDYRQLIGLRNGWLYNKTQQATKVKPTEKKAAARTARPGTSNVPKSTTPVKRAKQRLAKTGKVQDAAKLFEQII